MSQDEPTGRPEPEANQPAILPTSTLAQGKVATAVGPRDVNVGGNVAGDIITGDVIHSYLTGTRTNFPHFTVGIENFLTTYLGSPEKPVPFGGRACELACTRATG